MSVLRYGSVTFPMSTLTSFRCEAVPDDRQADIVYTKFDIGIQCVVSVDMLDLMAPDLIVLGTGAPRPGAENPANIISWIHSDVMKPRQNLSFKFNDFEFIPRQPGGNSGTADAKNGPTPISFTPIQLNNKTWLLNYHVVAHYRVHYRASAAGNVTFTSAPGNVVLSNNWEERVELDECQFTKRTRKGKYLISSSNSQGQIADMVRSQMAVVGTLPGCVRERAEYTVQPDGLGLGYTIVDQEVWRMPPPPAFKADGEYEEEASKADGKRIGHCWVKLWGSKGTSQLQLAKTAAAVVAGKLDIEGARFFDKNKDNRGLVLGARLKIGLYGNWAFCQMSALYTCQRKRVQGVSWLSKNLDLVHLSSGYSTAPGYKDRGDLSYLLQAAAYYDPDFEAAVLKSDQRLFGPNYLTPDGKNQMSRGLRPGEAGRTAEVIV